MPSYLDRLAKKMPPPDSPPNSNVDWRRLEAGVGLKYPDSFKEFVSRYGSSVWCGHFAPFYSLGQSEKEIEEFVEAIKSKVKPLAGNMYDEKYKKIEMPLYPDAGGLLPFMIDYSGSLYCWKTEGENADGWPIACWFTGQTIFIEETSITQMILGWLEREPRFANLLGDAGELPTERLCLT